ncbi:hypothetical protein JOC85_001884 [Bacillus mesophilus]|uniref:Uncharacterized protein n=1 Tax=Bacillus mesophilus TaxID=1808955 RepID=A0A6M0Q8M1_9BACI|nr:hypothetical protein [Bacillus mesophilus]MBM7661112.1 hypothetical protein [Bacillus mesophilus]NEY71358.1 hypothetical protein [Bacillus mesophilus]
MKKIIIIMFIVIIFAISFLWSLDYISHDGEFTKWNHSTAGQEQFKDGSPIYLGYNFTWEGFGNPILEKVEFIKRDGTIVAKDDDEFHIEPYIASTERIGVLDEDTVMKEGLNNDFVNVKDFRINKNFYLVLRVKYVGNDLNNVVNDIESLRFTYKKYGVTQFQNIAFNDGIITGE